MIASVPVECVSVIAFFIHFRDRIAAVRQHAVIKTSRGRVIAVVFAAVTLFHCGVDFAVAAFGQAHPLALCVAVRRRQAVLLSCVTFFTKAGVCFAVTANTSLGSALRTAPVAATCIPIVTFFASIRRAVPACDNGERLTCRRAVLPGLTVLNAVITTFSRLEYSVSAECDGSGRECSRRRIVLSNEYRRICRRRRRRVNRRIVRRGVIDHRRNDRRRRCESCRAA